MPLKKPTPGVSPGGQKSVAAVLSDEATKDLHKLIQSSIKEAMKPFTDQLRDLTTNVGECQKRVKAVEKSTQKIEMAAEESKLKINQLQKKTTAASKNQEVLEGHLIALQFEKSSTVLRFHNIKEEEKEELKTVMMRALAPMINSTQEELQREILTAYRIATGYTKQHDLPGEVQVRFSSKRLRDEILRASSEKQLIMGGSKISILRDIPYLARKRRKKYKDLAKLLLDNKINYTWLIEGIKFAYRGETVKITSVFKMKEFLRRGGGIWAKTLLLQQVAIKKEMKTRQKKSWRRRKKMKKRRNKQKLH